MKRDHYKISRTALMCAETRALCTEMPYVTEICEEILDDSQGMKSLIPGKVPDWAMSIIMKMPFSLRELAKFSVLEGRYYSNNEAIDRLGNGVPVLEIASGLSPRGLDLGKDRIFLETDLPEMISQKEQIVGAVLERQQVERSPTHLFQEANALDSAALSKAAQTIRSHDAHSPFAIVHEGLLMYFDDDELARLRDSIGEILRKYNPDGAWITSDFSFRADRYFMKFLKWKLESQTGRAFNCFSSQSDVGAFLGKAGLRVEFLPNRHIARNSSCIRKAGFPVQEVLKHAEIYESAFITLA